MDHPLFVIGVTRTRWLPNRSPTGGAQCGLLTVAASQPVKPNNSRRSRQFKILHVPPALLLPCPCTAAFRETRIKTKWSRLGPQPADRSRIGQAVARSGKSNWGISVTSDVTACYGKRRFPLRINDTLRSFLQRCPHLQPYRIHGVQSGHPIRTLLRQCCNS